jgi:hypothetical protein
MRGALIVVSRGPRSVGARSTTEGGITEKRIALIVSVAAVLMLVGATLAFGGPGRLLYDDGAYVKPGSLDDGKDLRSQATVSLKQAVANAQTAAAGDLGQVDLEHYESRLVYTVDVGDQEVHVDATNGRIDGITPRD